MAAYTVEPELHHVLCQEVPKVGELQRVYGFEQHLAEVCRRHLFSNCPCVRLTDVDRAVFLLVNAVPGVIRASLQDGQHEPGNERLVEDLTDMIVRYLA
jgi:hypothetical protein